MGGSGTTPVGIGGVDIGFGDLSSRDQNRHSEICDRIFR